MATEGLKTLNNDEALIWPPEAVTAARQQEQEAEHQLEYFSSDWVYTPPPAPKQLAECPAQRHCKHHHGSLPDYYIRRSRWQRGRRNCYDRELWLWSQAYRRVFGTSPDIIDGGRVIAHGTDVYQHIANEQIAAEQEHERTVGLVDEPHEPITESQT